MKFKNSTNHKLFTIETNINFDLISIKTFKYIKKIAKEYSIGEIKFIKKINKPSNASSIYLLNTNKGDYILRSADLNLLRKVEFQCLITNKLKLKNCLKPLKNNKNTFTIISNKKVWLIYPKVKGNIFSGSNIPLKKLFSYGLEFFKELEALENFKTEYSKHALGENFVDKKIFNHIPNLLLENKNLDALNKSNYINSFTKYLIQENKDIIKELLLRIKNINSDKKNLVHYDLQHANIIINKNIINFIDLEDIIWANKKIAISHFIFKNIRHKIFSNKKFLNLNEIQNNIQLIYDSDSELNSHEDFISYSLLRIFNDISIILNKFYLENDDSFMYDFEKKIHNLFEFIYLFC